jgi:hypothetical protein
MIDYVAGMTVNEKASGLDTSGDNGIGVRDRYHILAYMLSSSVLLLMTLTRESFRLNMAPSLDRY